MGVRPGLGKECVCTTVGVEDPEPLDVVDCAVPAAAAVVVVEGIFGVRERLMAWILGRRNDVG